LIQRFGTAIPDVRDILEGFSHSIVVLLPSHTLQNRVGLGQRLKLELRWWREFIFGKDLFSLCLLLWVFLDQELESCHWRKLGVIC
jgi:hypothetical protein